MSALKQNPSSHASSYGQPLPFRSREPANLSNLGNQHVSWAPINPATDLKSNTNPNAHSVYSLADKENVKSWLDSTSPTSVLKAHARQQEHVQSQGEMDPPSPSPVCSPSPSSPLSSPRASNAEGGGTDRVSPPQTAVQNSSDQTSFQAHSPGIKIEELGSTSKRHGKDIAAEAPPDSPTGSSFSSGSEGGLLALLASKLLSYKENGKRFSRYARESSGPIDEKHVMEDRSQKPPVEEIPTGQPSPPPIQGPLSSNGLYRTSSEAVSEISLGSANGRTLSMEFDAMLAAAVATGIGQAAALQDQPQQPLPGIHEDVSLRAGGFGGHQHNAVSRALVRVGTASTDDEATRLTNALTVMRQGRQSEDIDFNSTFSEWPVSTRSSISSGSRRGILEEDNNMQIVTTTAMISVESPETGSALSNVNREVSLASSSSGSNAYHSLAMVLATHDHASRAASDRVESMLSSSGSSSSSSKDRNMAPIAAIPARQALQKVRRDKVMAQALAFQDAKSSKCNNRYKREESKIIAWENQQKIKAGIRMKKSEMKLEQKRAKALEKMQNEIARAHKTAEERKACAEAVRASKTAKVAQLADSIRRSGKVSSATNVGCFPF